jgi:DNA-directed RNA polymerase I, II, and III subunit RPABC5
MIIPIRCFSCGKLISNIWNDYIQEVQSEYLKAGADDTKTIVENIEHKSIECKLLDKYEIKRYCCRRMVLAHVDLCEKI